MNRTIEPAVDWKPAADAEYGDIRYETSEGIAKVTICRPEVRNAFRPRTLFELQDAFERARNDSTIGVVVLTGEGAEAFCSGGDQRIRGDDGYVGDDGVGRLNVLDLQVQIRRTPKPVVAMVAGFSMRVAIAGRPPVTNLYSSALFIGFAPLVGYALQECWRSRGRTRIIATAVVILLMAAAIAVLTLAMSLPAMADRHRHGGYGPQVHHHYHHHDYRADRGRHHHKPRPQAYRKHRAGPPRRVVEHHYYSTPSRDRYYRDRHYRGHTDIPLVSVDGYPLLRIQVNH